MDQVVIAGGGWAGCAAALQAAKGGVRVTLLERTDMLLGTGLVGGIMRNNGRFTASEEMLSMGGGELITVTDQMARHKNINFPGHHHATLYDISKVAGSVEEMLIQAGVEILFRHRVTDVVMDSQSIKAVIVDNGKAIEGGAFVDATGTAGPIKNCTTYGNGCAMCIYRCPSFGGRVSLTELAGVQEIAGRKPDGTLGAMSGSCKLSKESLSRDIVDRLEQHGVAVIPIPAGIKKEIDLSAKACQQYNLKSYQENIILLDTGYAKLMTPYFPLDHLKRIPGFEKARFADPYAGGMGNSIRFVHIAPRDEALRVNGVNNLFCAGEKAGLLVGHTEAICTGVLAGFNAAQVLQGESISTLPESTAVGDAIAYTGRQMATEEGLQHKYTFSGSVYFDRMKERSLYTIDVDEIRNRVVNAGFDGFFSKIKNNKKNLTFGAFVYSHQK